MNTTLVLGLALTFGAPALKEKPSNDPSSVIGEWELTSDVVNGRVSMSRVDKIVLTADKWSVLFNGRESIGLTLRVGKAGEFDLGNPQTAEYSGIYKLDGNTLTICLSMNKKQRPTEFVSTPNSNTQLLILKRLKPEK